MSRTYEENDLWEAETATERLYPLADPHLTES